MRMSLRNGVIQLAEGKPLAFRGARAVHLECTEGRVWLTVAGQAGDFLLGKGERLRIESNGLALVEGFPAGSIRLVSVTPWPIRWANRWHRRFDPFGILPGLARAGYRATGLTSNRNICRPGISQVGGGQA